MWNERFARSERVSVDADRLAQYAFRHHLQQANLARIEAAAFDRGSLLVVRSIADPIQATARVWWFRSAGHVDKILHEMVTLEAMPWTAVRTDAGVHLDVSVDRVADVIAECHRWVPRVRPVTDAEIDARMSSVKREIERWLLRLQATGALKSLNQQYKALRTQPRLAGEPTVPRYQAWATAQIEQMLQQQIDGGATAAGLFQDSAA